MATKLYFHDAVSTVVGTLPASNVSVSATTPSQIGDSGTNRSMNRTIGVSQTSKAITTAANTNAQPSLIVRFVSDRLASQTFALTGVGDISLGIAGSESLAASNFRVRISLATWRPSTGALVTRIHDLATNATAEPGTSETSLTATNAAGGTSATVADGDVLICEIWRDSTTQGNANARTNTVFYDGTTEASTTTNAAFINFPNDTLIFAPQVMGQALADIKATGIEGFGQTAALISGSALSVTDTFTRTVSPNFGTSSSGLDWSTIFSNVTLISVDGTQGLVNGNNQHQAEISLERLFITNFEALVDVKWSIASSSPAGNSFRFDTRITRSNTIILSGISFAVIINNATSKAQIKVYSTTVGSDLTTSDLITITADTYYRVKFRAINNLNLNNVFIQAKIWLATDPEPLNWDLDSVLTIVSPNILIGGHFESFYSLITGSQTLYTDNLSINPTILSGVGQAQATIIKSAKVFGQANALINGTFFSAIDTFTRSITDNWGNNDTGDTYLLTAGTAADLDVNGTTGTIIQNTGAAKKIIHLKKTLVNRQASSRGVSLKFRFQTTDLPFLTFNIGVGSSDTGTSNKGYVFYVGYNGGNNVFTVGLGEGSSTSAQLTTLTPAAGWYIFEGTAVKSSNSTTAIRGKITQEGSPSTDYLTRFASSTTPTNPGHVVIIVDDSGVNTIYTIDDVEIVDASWTESGQAQANIKVTSNAFAQAQAYLVVTNNQFAQAAALIDGSFPSLPFNETFTRSVTDSLGTSDNGDTWVLTSGTASNFDVNGTQATIVTISSAISQKQELKQTKILNATGNNGYELTVTLNLDKVPDTTQVYFLVTFLAGSSYYTPGSFPYVNSGATLIIGNNGNNLKGYGYINTTQWLTSSNTISSYTSKIVTLKWQILNVSNNSILFRSKFWDITTNEPEWSYIDGPIGSVHGLLPPGHVIAQVSSDTGNGNKPFTFTVNDFNIIEAGLTYSGQAQAEITTSGVTTTNAYGQSQAKINTTRIFAQSQADIKVKSNIFAQAQADIKTTSRAFAQANADIKQTYPYSVTIFSSSADGYITSQNADYETARTGSTLVTTAGSNNLITGQFPPGAAYNIYEIFISFDTTIIYSPPTTAILSLYGQSDTSVADFILEARVYDWGTSLTTADWVPGNNLSSLALLAHYDTANGWSLSGYNNFDNDTLLSNINFGGITRIVINNSNTTLDIPPTSNEAVIAFANEKGAGFQPRLTVTYGGGFGQAQADILVTSRTYAQANADIKVTTNAFAQAQAKIIPTRVFAQSQADILATSQAYAQAQSDIKVATNVFTQAQGTIIKTSQVYAQVNADIKVTSNSFAQAQSDIKVISNVFAQTQARITNTYNVFAQSQADIKATINAFAQSNADIKATSNNFAQANAAIKVIINVFAQAQAQIITTYQGYGQAQACIKGNAFAQSQADIKVTSQVYAQAQADIKVTSREYGQAQADIKATSNAFAQANSDIKAVSNSYAQAQADIKVTTNQFAQTQTWIESTVNQYAQTQADVKATVNGFAQAQAKINAFAVQAYAQALSNIKGIDIEGVGQAQAKINAFGVQGYGQAQADIKAVSNGYGQAQSDIKATTNIFAQAQADIKVTTSQFAQAQVDIKSTTNHFGQANADIKASSNGYGQSQADIKVTYQVYAQAQADIKSVTNQFAQTQADIKQAYQVYAQAQGDIKQIYNVFAQAQALIVVIDIEAFAQAQADIKVVTNQFAQTQADIKQQYQGYAQAQSDIKATLNSFAQANADILATINAFAQAQGYILVTDIEAVAQAQADIKTTYQAYAQANARIIAFGVNQFAQAQGNIRFNGSTASGQAQARIYAFNYPQWAQANADIKAINNSFTQAQADILHTYNQFAQAQTDIVQTYQDYGQSQADIKSTYQGYAQAQGHIVVTDIETFAQAQANILTQYQGYANTQANIQQTYQGYANTQADIKSTYQGYGQSQALIVINDIESFGQSQADILTTYFGFAQTQANIKSAGYGFGQAACSILGAKLVYAQTQADIKAAGYGFGQAQSDIKVTSQRYAQAQSDIKTTNIVYAQVNAQIVTTKQSYGQAQGTIKSIISSCGQAQSDIKATSNKWAQTQADIKVTNTTYGQANALISTIKTGFGQAQADIKATSRGYGQAQSDILVTTNKFANAQSDIKVTNIINGQSQAYIKAKINSYGQAQGYITSGTIGIGQAQALILRTENSYAQAQAQIIKSAGYGQAKALIIQLHRLKKLRIRDQILINLVLSDRESILINQQDTEINLTLSDRSGLGLYLSDRNSLEINITDINY